MADVNGPELNPDEGEWEPPAGWWDEAAPDHGEEMPASYRLGVWEGPVAGEG